ncbi:MAG: hypothetical protein V4677_02605 [Bacteroidota bacterium]
MKKIICCVIVFICGLNQLSAQTVSKKGTAIANQKKTFKTEASSEDVFQKLVDSGFPKYVSTGYPAGDNARYQKQKEKWISENPELYKALTRPKTITAKK